MCEKIAAMASISFLEILQILLAFFFASTHIVQEFLFKPKVGLCHRVTVLLEVSLKTLNLFFKSLFAVLPPV